MSSYTDNLKQVNEQLKSELAELKQVINKLPSRNSACLVNEVYNAIELVKAFAKAKELKK
jgi:hypothetical protein